MNWHILAVFCETPIFNLVELCELTNYFCVSERKLGELALHRIFAKKKAHFGRIRPARNGHFHGPPSSRPPLLLVLVTPGRKRDSGTGSSDMWCPGYLYASRSFLLRLTSYRLWGPGSTCAGGWPRNNKKLCEPLRTKHPGAGIVEDL